MANEVRRTETEGGGGWIGLRGTTEQDFKGSGKRLVSAIRPNALHVAPVRARISSWGMIPITRLGLEHQTKPDHSSRKQAEKIGKRLPEEKAALMNET
ncbi:hypothetical protein [Thermithiobacillus plumbiphilus]|uniref:Uncharacterized protein n=1 Tax=Thermithiobacillus plumbiphilus TaxID=1729899 RepID=A0ABU9D6C3_9PROT